MWRKAKTYGVEKSELSIAFKLESVGKVGLDLLCELLAEALAANEHVDGRTLASAIPPGKETSIGRVAFLLRLRLSHRTFSLVFLGVVGLDVALSVGFFGVGFFGVSCLGASLAEGFFGVAAVPFGFCREGQRRGVTKAD